MELWWDLRLLAKPYTSATMDSLQKSIWADELGKAGPLTPIPEEQTLMELLKSDTTVLGFVDNKLTPVVIETLTDRGF